LTFHAVCSARLVFSSSGFHLLVCNEACPFRNQQAERGQVATIVLSGTRGPSLFLVIRDGLAARVGCETTCPRHAAPNLPAETRSRTRVSREPDGPPLQKISGMERIRSETLKLFVVEDVGRRSTLLSSIRSVRSWQCSWPRLGTPSLAAGLWPLKPHKTPRTVPACRKPDRRTLKQVLLRSAKPLAAWDERKHQSAATAMLPARHRLDIRKRSSTRSRCA
jgi:hypothetical protein